MTFAVSPRQAFAPPSLPAEAARFLEQLKIDPIEGLTAQQVEAHRRRFGSNQVDLPVPEPWWKSLLAKFKENPIPILIGAAVVSIVLAFAQGHFPLDGIAILIAVGLATGVGFINEHKSGIEYEKLKLSRLNVPVTVTRNGREEKISVHEVVVGDIVHLETGSKIPADCLLLRGESMEVDESRMTGESVPTPKGVDEASVRLYGGTDVARGTATTVVTRVGNDSKWGEIARQLAAEEQEKTPLEERLDGLTAIINKVGTWAAVLIFLALTAELVVRALVMHDVVLGLDATTFSRFVDFFIVAITIVVVAVPEGLPMAVNVSLAYSMKKITAEKNLVRKMVATETIGAANVICSDKTGTLTENKMKVVHLWLAGQRWEGDSLMRLKGHSLFDLIELSATVNSTAHLIDVDGETVPDGNSTEGALLTWVTVQGSDYRRLRRQSQVVQRIPFNAEIKRMTSVIRVDGGLLALVKGAPERILPLCSCVETERGAEPIDHHRGDVQAEIDSITGQAMRGLALAYKRLPADEVNAADADRDLTLLALVGIADPMRENVPEAIGAARRAGIDVKMVTGDNVQTARVLAHQLGLIDDDSIVLEGHDFRELKDEDLLGILPRLRVLARAEPLDKFRLVNLLKSLRLVVAVTGDGFNDAPALRTADVGLAMGRSGTEVAKEASDIVLLDDNFSSIVRAVHWGRALYENIQKFIQFQLTVNVSALATAFLSPLLNLLLVPLTHGRIHLLQTPLTVTQLLWVNLIMDTLAVLAFCLDEPASDTMHRPPVGRTEPFITRAMWRNILGMGLYFTLMLIVLQATHFLGSGSGGSLELSSIIFTTYIFFQVFNQLNCRVLNPRRSAFSGLLASRKFLSVVAFIVIVQIVLTQIGGKVFATEPLSLMTWGKILLLTSTALWIGEAARLSQRRARNH
jgi:P-type Ca2+ transporter type 2C